ncbi:MAG: S24 family peptidase [Pseudomonadota bacterium]
MASDNMPASINMQEGICLPELVKGVARDYASRMERSILSRNITALRQHLEMTQAEFADAMEVSQSDVSKWESRGTMPGGTSLALLVEKAGARVNDFLYKPWRPKKQAEGAPRLFSVDDFADEHGLAFIEEVNLALGMGARFLESEPESLGLVPFRKEWIRGMFAGPISALKVVRGTGDSMEPTIRDGDFVLIDTSQQMIDDQDLIFAVTYGELGMIRRLRQLPNGGVRMMPDNPVVRPEDAFDGELRILGKVVWIGRRIVSRR